ALGLGSLAAMMLVLMSNNLGIMWVGMEATTLLSAFLISLYPNRLSLEAMWKYLIICSIGLAFAFMGTLLAAASIQSASAIGADALFWTHLASSDAHLDPTLMKFAFVFVLVGYGTKAGLAPIHSWLPDAHSQAPAPVSAMFSGFLLNTALYCIMRFVPPVQPALGEHFASGLLARPALRQPRDAYDLRGAACRLFVGHRAPCQPVGVDRRRAVFDLHERISAVARGYRRERLACLGAVSGRERGCFRIGIAASSRHGVR